MTRGDDVCMCVCVCGSQSSNKMVTSGEMVCVCAAAVEKRARAAGVRLVCSSSKHANLLTLLDDHRAEETSGRQHPLVASCCCPTAESYGRKMLEPSPIHLLTRSIEHTIVC
jgi:hypothetical protein